MRAALTGVAGFAVLGLFTAVVPGFLGQVLGIDDRAVVGLLVFAVFAASAAGQLLAPALGGAALAAGSGALLAGMGLFASGLGLSSLALLVAGGIVARLGQGLSFRAGLTAVNEATPAARRGEVASSFFVVVYLAISLPVVGVGLLADFEGLTVAVFVAALAATALVLVKHRKEHMQ